MEGKRRWLDLLEDDRLRAAFPYDSGELNLSLTLPTGEVVRGLREVEGGPYG